MQAIPRSRDDASYLTARAELFTLGYDALVVIDIVLPAVLGSSVYQYTASFLLRSLWQRTGFDWESGRRSL